MLSGGIKTNSQVAKISTSSKLASSSGNISHLGESLCSGKQGFPKGPKAEL